MRSKVRPSINEVLKELESLWLQLCGICKHLDPVNEDDRCNEDALLSESLWRNSSCTVMPNDASFIQMSEFGSHPVTGKLCSVLIILSMSIPCTTAQRKKCLVGKRFCMARKRFCLARKRFFVWPGIDCVWPVIVFVWPGIVFVWPGVTFVWPGIVFVSPGMEVMIRRRTSW